MYDSTRQYRCDIIRGKSKKEMDDLLPAYALVINEICPCEQSDFELLFNNAFQRFLPEHKRKKKTLDNHRTEISGKLFGMYYFARDGMVYESERTQKYLEDNDQPAFFKDICYKLQFPNGMQKPSPTVKQRVEDGICVRPLAYVLKLLQVAETAHVDITKKNLGYYVLNSLDVLQGKASPYEVLEAIAKDRADGIERDIVVPGKAGSYTHQHITEQINYLEIANLIRVTDDKRVVQNKNEEDAINLFVDVYDKKPDFDVYKYDLATREGRKEFQYDWDEYNARLSSYAALFSTTSEALVFEPEEADADGDTDSNTGAESPASRPNLTEFGDEGEEVVFRYEKERVRAYNPRLANKVLSLGKTRGIGYDIQSVVAEPGDMEEFVKYLEVKSTKRYTSPDPKDNLWVDTLNITRNEWVAARQHGRFYSIARVYFTKDGIKMFLLENVAEKLDDGRITATPMTYRMDFTNTSIDKVIELKRTECEV